MSLWLVSVHQTGDLVLRRSLLFGDGLGVGVQSDPAGRMPEELLNNLDVSAARAQEPCAGAAERVPSYFLRDTNMARHRADSITDERLAPIRLSSLAVGLAKTQSVAGLYLV